MPIHLPTQRRQGGMNSIFYLTKATSRKQGKTQLIAEAHECKVAIRGQILQNKSRRIGNKRKHQVKQKRHMSYQ